MRDDIHEVAARVRRGLADTHMTADRADIEALADAVDVERALADCHLGSLRRMLLKHDAAKDVVDRTEDFLRETNRGEGVLLGKASADALADVRRAIEAYHRVCNDLHRDAVAKSVP
jgi:hypothetical protein